MLPGTLGALSRSALEAAINALLRLDPASQLALKQLAGKRLKITSSQPAVSVLVVLDYPLSLLDGQDWSADSELTGTAQDLIGLLHKPTHSLAGTGVTHRGDMGLLQALVQLAKQLDLDWGQLLAQACGPVVGPMLQQLLAKPLQYAQSQWQHLPPLLGDYLQHELQLVPGAEEIRAFGDEVQTLREATDRLAARLERWL